MRYEKSNIIFEPCDIVVFIHALIELIEEHYELEAKVLNKLQTIFQDYSEESRTTAYLEIQRILKEEGYDS